jgi:hypothetical protein
VLLSFDESPYHHVSLASTLRLYSNNDVLDGFVCIRHQGTQHNIRVSRRLRPHLDNLLVGTRRQTLSTRPG